MLAMGQCRWSQLALEVLRYSIYIFLQLKLCLATVTHDFSWVKLHKHVQLELKIC